jgi:hypothetical protein
MIETPAALKLVEPAADPGPRYGWFKFDTDAWTADECLGLCTMAARGLLAALMCLMHRARPYGYLLVGDKVPTDAELARLVRATSAAEVRRLRGELLDHGVLSITADGILYSRRMVRAAKQSGEARDHGLRGGNPALKGLTPTMGRPLTPALTPALTPTLKHKSTEYRSQRKSARPRARGAGLVFSGTTFTLSEKQHAVIVSFLGIRKEGVNLQQVYGDADAEWAVVGFQPDDLLRELKQRAKRASDAKADLLTGPDDVTTTMTKLDRLEGREGSLPRA